MKLLCVASLLASAAAFTTSPAAFNTFSVERSLNTVEENAHRTRKATIVMDGKANGTSNANTHVGRKIVEATKSGKNDGNDGGGMDREGSPYRSATQRVNHVQRNCGGCIVGRSLFSLAVIAR